MFSEVRSERVQDQFHNAKLTESDNIGIALVNWDNTSFIHNGRSNRKIHYIINNQGYIS